MDLADHLERIERTDASTAGPAEVALVGQSIQFVRGFLLSREGEFARRSTELHEAGRGHAAEDVIQRGSRSSQRDAAKTKKRSDALGRAPHMDRALSKGHVSADHADALADVIGRIDDEQVKEQLLELDDELAASASTSTPEQFRRRLATTVRKLAADDGLDMSEQQRRDARINMGYDNETGMGRIQGQLHPDEFQRLRRKIDHEVAAMRKLEQFQRQPHERLAAVALMHLVDGKRVSQPAPSEVVVLIDGTSLVSGPHDRSFVEYSDGMPLPVETARRHACNAHIIPVVLDGGGQPLDVGRKQRLATPAQRHALRSMYRTCAVGNCGRSFERCEVHHLQEWEELGPTDLANLLPICGYHHHRAHEGRWRLQLDPSSRELTVYLPDGTLHSRTRPDIIEERLEDLTNDAASRTAA